MRTFAKKGYMNNLYTVNNYKLDNNQIQFLLCNNNSMVIAGAGSGKTLTIVGKVKYLIEAEKINEKEILVLSFTNDSVDNIKSKIQYNIDVLNFHKLAINIINKAGYSFNIANPTLLNYITNEFLHTLTSENQKIIRKYLKINNYNQFLDTKEYYSFKNMILAFINNFKANGYTIIDLKNANYNKIEKKIIIIIMNIYNEYIKEKASNNSLDFDDLIIYAKYMVEKVSLKYKYVIIDEFQDTSIIRLNLISEIVNKCNAKIAVVGDDWQSIYQFSGCNIFIFLNFPKLFKNITTLYLNNTYRNSFELIKVAGSFIMKNKMQLKKQLYSDKNDSSPIIFVPYKNAKQAFKNILNTLSNKSDDIMVISRNNNDIIDYLDDEITYNNNVITYDNKSIKYLTVHKSKGLEAEYIIVLNCNNHYLGFPNKIEDNKLIRKLNPNKEIKYAEERRLFYVALTRCKMKVFLMYCQNEPSIFVKELKKLTKKQLGKVVYFNKLF